MVLLVPAGGQSATGGVGGEGYFLGGLLVVVQKLLDVLQFEDVAGVELVVALGVVVGADWSQPGQHFSNISNNSCKPSAHSY